MATKLYFRQALSDFGTGTNNANLIGTAVGWQARLLSTAAGSSTRFDSNATVTGATNGVELDTGLGRLVWYSPPLNADITISGSVTWNIWGRESDMAANVAINGRLEVIDGATGTITLIDQTARTTELAISASVNSVNNFAETPASGVACKRGDRLRVRIFGDDVGTMASGFTFGASYDGGTASADGDSWLQLTENLTFVSEPAGTTIYPTDTASAVSTASVDREAWTSRGAGVQTDVTNTATGWTAPIQVTDTAGGTVVDWFTKQLTAFTLGGAVRVNARALESNAAANAVVRCEIARVESDGTSPTVWGATTFGGAELGTTEAAVSFLVGGDDLAVSDGQRLRVRFYIDDVCNVAMGASQTVTLYYAGTSGGASGDTYLTFTQTLTEYVPPATTVYLNSALATYATGTNTTGLGGSGLAWIAAGSSTSRGSADSTANVSTATGPTNGIEIAGSGIGREWWSDPIDADVTIAGPITFNLWAFETNASANAAINAQLWKADGATGALTLIHQTVRTTELDVSASVSTVNTWAETPSAGVALKRGDRLRFVPFIDDAGTMATGFTVTFRWGTTTAGAERDSWFGLTEAVTFVSEPAGTTIYPTDTASTVSTASVDREAWTSRGAGVQTDVTNTATGWTAPIQVTDTAGGTVVDWFTRQLTAFTLGGAVRANLRVAHTSLANTAYRLEIAVVASDGTSPTVWGVATTSGTGTSEAARSFLVGGDDLAVTDGQRIRLRLSVDDVSSAAMASGGTATLYYAGTSGGASGDTYLTFTQTLTEFTSGTQATAQVATATGDAHLGADAVVATLAVATTTGTANNPTARPGIATTTEVATGTGVALDIDAKVASTAQVASGTGAAYNATVATAVSVTAQVATATGTASNASVTQAKSVTAEVATATGVALDADLFPSQVFTASAATATGAALDATVTTGGAAVSANAEVATATGTALDADAAPGEYVNPDAATATGTALGTTASIAATVGAAAGTAAAYDATASTASMVSATAQVATATGSVTAAAPSIAPDLDAATATGTAITATAHETQPANLQAATATGAAQDVDAKVGATSQLANATGAALPVTSKVTVNAGVATGTGAALVADGLPGTLGLANVATATGAALVADGLPGELAPAEVAATAGAAQNGTTKIAPTLQAAAATGAANNATVSVASTGQVTGQTAEATGAAQGTDAAIAPRTVIAAATGTAANPSVHTAISRTAGVAAATGAAGDVDAKVAVNAGSAAATGTAANATVTTTAAASATAQVATAQGAAHAATVGAASNISATAAAATASGTAYNARVVVAAVAQAATGTGNVHAAAIAVAVAAYAETATATGAAWDAGVALGAVAALAEAAVATGTAYDARAQTAIGSGIDTAGGIHGGIVSLPAIHAGMATVPGVRGGIAASGGVRGGIVTEPRIKGRVA